MNTLDNRIIANAGLLARNLNINDFATWAGQGAHANKNRRLVLGQEQIRNRNMANQPPGLPHRQVQQARPPAQPLPQALNDRNSDRSDRQSLIQNKTARQTFLKVIQRECGARNMDELPYDVRVAMKLESKGSYPHQRKDWLMSKAASLSARRVAAVSTAVINYKNAVNAKFRALGLLQPGEDWLNNNINNNNTLRRSFWNGLSSGVKQKLLSIPIEQGQGARHPLRLMWEDYSRIPAGQGVSAARKNFLTAVNMHFKNNEVIPYWSISVPMDSHGTKDPVGAAIKNQMESNDIVGYHADPTVHPLKDVLRQFDRERAVLTIDYDKPVGYGRFDTGAPKLERHTITLMGGGDRQGNSLQVKYDDNPFLLVVGEDEDETGQFRLLQDNLCESTGLSPRELYILLSKSTTLGFSAENGGAVEKDNYLLAQSRKSGLCSPSAKITDNSPTACQTQIHIGSAKTPFRITQDVYAVSHGFTNHATRRGGDVLVANHESDAEALGGPDSVNGAPNHHKLHFECDYVMSGGMKSNKVRSHKIKSLRYGLDYQMTQLNRLGDVAEQLAPVGHN